MKCRVFIMISCMNLNNREESPEGRSCIFHYTARGGGPLLPNDYDSYNRFDHKFKNNFGIYSMLSCESGI